MSRKNKNKTIGPTGIIIIAVLAVMAVLGGLALTGLLSIGGNVPVDEDGNPVTSCAGDITPDLLINAINGEDLSASLTEATNLYRKVGTTKWSTFTAGTEISSLEAGAEYEFVMGISTSDMTDNAYGEYFTHVVKCQEDETIEKMVYNDEIETSLSATFYNADGDASAETFSAGESQVVSMKLKAGSEEWFGNKNIADSGVVVLKLNKSEWERPNKVYLADGRELSAVSLPQRYDQQASGYIEYAYAIPAIGDVNTEIFFDMEADGTNAPSIDGTAYIYAGSYYIADDGSVATGVEDEDGTAVGTDAPDSLTLDFTA